VKIPVTKTQDASTRWLPLTLKTGRFNEAVATAQRAAELAPAEVGAEIRQGSTLSQWQTVPCTLTRTLRFVRDAIESPPE